MEVQVKINLPQREDTDDDKDRVHASQPRPDILHGVSLPTCFRTLQGSTGSVETFGGLYSPFRENIWRSRLFCVAWTSRPSGVSIQHPCLPARSSLAFPIPCVATDTRSSFSHNLLLAATKMRRPCTSLPRGRCQPRILHIVRSGNRTASTCWSTYPSEIRMPRLYVEVEEIEDNTI